MTAVAAALGASVANADEGARADGARASWAPAAALFVGSFDERARVTIDGHDYDEVRGQLRVGAALGLAHPVAPLGWPRAWVDGRASVGLALAAHTGHWQIPLREDVMVAWQAARWAVVRAGIGVGASIDASATARSFGELGAPIGITLFRTIELVYRPILSVPFASETSPVFGGERSLSTRLAILPFELGVGVRAEALGW